ncbi:hypothetical protein [Bacillus alkalicellulosilyticus]|uniref:hypothetical protein n=1 Tax=Alkalihalobacterium alkalicellulosilyticum TaxID=1912214 RepID=UPI000996ECC9|nr:hypothetical protein [Bacillus alkalicellulosilyticus]
MYVIASFEYSTSLELALKEIEDLGINKENIFVVPLDKSGRSETLFDTIHHSDGKSLLDIAFVLGGMGMLIGTVYGFDLAWGPIWCGLIGLGIGSFLGLGIDLVVSKKKKRAKQKKKTTEVFVMVTCSEKQMKSVENVLWKQFALGVAVIDK